MEITRSVAGHGGRRFRQRPDGKGNSDGGRGGLRITGTAGVTDEDVDVPGAEFLRSGDGRSRGAASTKDGRVGCGNHTRVADCFDDASHISVVPHPTHLSGVVLENDRVDDAKVGTGAADFIHFLDHRRFQRHGHRKAAPGLVTAERAP